MAVSGRLTLTRYNLGDMDPMRCAADRHAVKSQRERFALLYRPKVADLPDAGPSALEPALVQP